MVAERDTAASAHRIRLPEHRKNLITGLYREGSSMFT